MKIVNVRIPLLNVYNDDLWSRIRFSALCLSGDKKKIQNFGLSSFGYFHCDGDVSHHIKSRGVYGGWIGVHHRWQSLEVIALDLLGTWCREICLESADCCCRLDLLLAVTGGDRLICT
jgi:hypothetical protein